MSKKSYYEYIDGIIEKLDEAYDSVGALRDSASSSEKKIYNDTRGALGPIASAWRQFRNSVSRDRGEMLF